MKQFWKRMFCCSQVGLKPVSALWPRADRFFLHQNLTDLGEAETGNCQGWLEEPVGGVFPKNNTTSMFFRSLAMKKQPNGSIKD